MHFLPQLTNLGKLNLIEVYEADDEPCLFSCQNANGQVFLAVLLDETATHRHWLYAAVSPQRFEQIRSGTVDLHDSFKRAEDGLVYVVKVPHLEDEVSLVEALPCERLSGDMLPLSNEFIEWKSQSELMAPRPR